MLKLINNTVNNTNNTKRYIEASNMSGNPDDLFYI